MVRAKHQASTAASDSCQEEENELDRLREENRRLQEENALLRGQKRRVKSYHKEARGNELSTAKCTHKQLESTIAELRTQLKESNQRLQSHTPLEGQQYSLKEGSGKGYAVPDNLRDLIVDYSIKDYIATNKVFTVLQQTLQALAVGRKGCLDSALEACG